MTTTTYHVKDGATYRVVRSNMPTFAMDMIAPAEAEIYFTQDEQAGEDCDAYDTNPDLFVEHLLSSGLLDQVDTRPPIAHDDDYAMYLKEMMDPLG